MIVGKHWCIRSDGLVNCPGCCSVVAMWLELDFRKLKAFSPSLSEHSPAFILTYLGVHSEGRDKVGYGLLKSSLLGSPKAWCWGRC